MFFFFKKEIRKSIYLLKLYKNIKFSDSYLKVNVQINIHSFKIILLKNI